MIKVVIFDLDGTLVRTEDLKALSYARAAVAFRPSVNEETVLDAYKGVVGLSRNEVSEHLLKELHLEEAARTHMEKHRVDAPWKAFAAERVLIYEKMIETPGLLEQYECPYNVGLLEYVKRERFRVALATMSHRLQAYRVLEILGLKSKFDSIATREDVATGKPDPEIYLLVAKRLGVAPQESLVIEDSVNGIKAALTAGMSCMAVTSNITRQSVHESKLVDRQWIVDDTALLMTIARQRIAEARQLSLIPGQSFSGYPSLG